MEKLEKIVKILSTLADLLKNFSSTLEVTDKVLNTVKDLTKDEKKSEEKKENVISANDETKKNE